MRSCRPSSVGTARRPVGAKGERRSYGADRHLAEAEVFHERWHRICGRVARQRSGTSSTHRSWSLSPRKPPCCSLISTKRRRGTRSSAPNPRSADVVLGTAGPQRSRPSRLHRPEVAVHPRTHGALSRARHRGRDVVVVVVGRRDTCSSGGAAPRPWPAGRLERHLGQARSTLHGGDGARAAPSVSDRSHARLVTGVGPLGVTAAQHHERIDGSGYPRNLRGDAMIPRGSCSPLSTPTSGSLSRDSPTGAFRRRRRALPT